MRAPSGVFTTCRDTDTFCRLLRSGSPLKWPASLCPIPPPAGVLSAHRHFEDSEGTIAYSDRPGFQVARWLSPLVWPGIRHTARKLWVDDLAYAERRYELRQRGEFPG